MKPTPPVWEGEVLTTGPPKEVPELDYFRYLI